jgi:hypothetical protein
LAAPYHLSLWGPRLRVAATIGPDELARAKEAASAPDADMLSSLGELSNS